MNKIMSVWDPTTNASGREVLPSNGSNHVQPYNEERLTAAPVVESSHSRTRHTKIFETISATDRDRCGVARFSGT